MMQGNATIQCSVHTAQKDFSYLQVPMQRMLYYTESIGSHLMGKNVLDMGCGKGLETLFYAMVWNPRMIAGVDTYGYEGGVPENRDLFENNIRRTACENIRIIDADAFNVPAEPGSVDVIIASQALHHLFSSEQDFRRIPRETVIQMAEKLRHWHTLLVPYGRLFVRDTYRYCMKRLLRPLPGFNTRVRYDRKQEPRGWIRLLEEAGFVIRDCRPYVPYTLRQFAPLMQHRVFSFFVTTFYHISAEKV
jgi:SAM-dependent methyltransferase